MIRRMEKKPPQQSPSRDSDKYIVRFPDGMRARIAELAKANGRSMNSEIVARLQASMEGGIEDMLTPMTKTQMDIVSGVRGISVAEALNQAVQAWLEPDAKSVVCIQVDRGMTMEQIRGIMEEASRHVPKDATVILESKA